MLTAILFILAVPTWSPPSLSPPQQIYDDFGVELARLSKELRPTNVQEENCIWAGYLILRANLNPPPLTPSAIRVIQEAVRFIRGKNDKGKDNCPDDIQKKGLKVYQAIFLANISTGFARTGVPFALPPLPDRAGSDLGTALWPMFQTLETSLAAAGQSLAGDARACAWAASALSAATAVQRTPGATAGIGAGVGVLEARQATYCQGAALAQKEAAWAWIRAHPGATQPLVVPFRPASAGPVLGPADGALWLTTALLILAPEAWPAFLVFAQGR